MSNKKIDFPVVSFVRLSDCCFGRSSKAVEVSHSTYNVFCNKIVDDSNYTPNSNYIRSMLASGQSFSKGVYDFPDGKDTGFNPQLRGLDIDMSDVDNVVNNIVNDAQDKQSKKQADEVAKKQAERNEKIMKNLENLGSQENSEKSSE